MSEDKVLNKEQLKAIKFGQGPLLIIAGAGTGKTTVITERIKHLISSSLAKPQEILALTFTEKASLEMETRVDEIMPYGYTQMWISTFHSFCDRILRDEALHIGLDSHYVLMTEAESLLFLKKHLFDLRLDYFRPAGNPMKFLGGLLTHFSRLKDEDISPTEYLDWAKTQNSKLKAQSYNSKLKTDQTETQKNMELVKAYQRYEELKVKNGVMDFADLISNTLKLFRLRKNILQRYQQKFKYLLVDEFQDTNISQNELVMLLAGEKANLTVVADDDQSIYRFRGSSISNVMQFKKIYPKAEIITLTKNYRSTQEILNKAYLLIQYNNPDRLEVQEKINKKLVSARKTKGKKIDFLFASRVENEAELVVEEIKKLTTENKRPGLSARPGLYNYSDMAILVRANNHAEPFVRALIRQGIPFQFLGPGKLFRQEEVKDLIAYLKVLYNFEDNVAFFRLLSLPIFNLSGREIAAIRNRAKKYNLSLFEAAEEIEQIKILVETKEKIKQIVKMIHQHLKLMPTQTAGQILYYFLEETGILKQLTEYKTSSDEQRAGNIAKFFDKLKTYESDHEEAGVEAIVDWLNLKMEMGESPLASDLDWTSENKVNLLTLHSGKGLEFPVVFLVNLVNDRFPTRARREQIPLPDELIKEILPIGDSHEEEERRLFYVGMTRAQNQLYFTAAKFYGEGKRMKKISPFVFEALGKEAISYQQSAISNQTSVLDFAPVKKLPTSHLPTPTPITYLSYSQLETFNRCPLQYKYVYLLRIPVPQGAASSFGTSIHQSLKDFYLQVMENVPVKKKDLLNALNNNWLKEGYSSKVHEKKMFKRATFFLSDFFDKGFKKTDKPIVLEQSFIIKLTPDLRIGGRLDRIDEHGETIEIIDYKTGKVPTRKEIEKNQQLTFYAMAGCDPGIYQKNPDQVTLSFYFFETQEKISTFRTLKDLQKARTEIIKKAKEISTSDFLPKPGPYCDFCAYKLLCPAWQ